jgi:histidinol dehydrogenase
MHISRFEFPTAADFSPIENHLKSRGLDAGDVRDKVAAILERVRRDGDSALVEYTRKFDCPDFSPEQLVVDRGEMEKAAERVDAGQLKNIRESVDRVREFHLKQKENSWFVPGPEGSITGQMNLPVQSAGLYVPGGQGGKTPLVSSLIMTAVPAQVAGVENICPVSPPGEDGTLNDYILATAHILGLERIFCCGSAWAIAALAWGTQTVPRVDVIAGPGNIFVSSAKELVSGVVGIDMIAGPSEIAILADDSADPAWLAADMLSQAEHDSLAASILVSSDGGVLDECERHLKEQLPKLSRRDIAQKSLTNCGALIKVPDLKSGMQLINRLAPEHFELCVQNPWEMLGKVKNAGAVFLGRFSPEAVGDYFAGPNHVLPTLASARYSSALSVDFFTKKTSIVATSLEYMQKHGDKVAALARLEGLDAHARSAEMRTGKSGL